MPANLQHQADWKQERLSDCGFDQTHFSHLKQQIEVWLEADADWALKMTQTRISLVQGHAPYLLEEYTEILRENQHLNQAIQIRLRR